MFNLDYVDDKQKNQEILKSSKSDGRLLNQKRI